MFVFWKPCISSSVKVNPNSDLSDSTNLTQSTTLLDTFCVKYVDSADERRAYYFRRKTTLICFWIEENINYLKKKDEFTFFLNLSTCESVLMLVSWLASLAWAWQSSDPACFSSFYFLICLYACFSYVNSIFCISSFVVFYYAAKTLDMTI